MAKVHEDDILTYYAEKKHLYPVKRLVNVINSGEFKRVRALNRLIHKMQENINDVLYGVRRNDKRQMHFAIRVLEMVENDILSMLDVKFKKKKMNKSEKYCYHSVRGAVKAIMREHYSFIYRSSKTAMGYKRA